MKKMFNLLLLTFSACVFAGSFDGALDTSFGNQMPQDGKILFPFDNGMEDVVANALVVRHDGIIVAGGSVADVRAGDRQFALAWFNPEGDASVAQATTTIFNTSEIQGLAVQPDNKVIAVGTTSRMAPTRQEFAIARYQQDGQLDPTFNPGGLTPGVITVNFFSKLDGMTVIEANAQAHAVALTQSGKIIVVGEAQDIEQLPGNTNSFYAIAVLNQDGSLDSSFANGQGRKVFSDVMPDGFTLNVRSVARAVAIQINNDEEKIVIAGEGFTDRDFFQIIRVTLTGDLDLGFGSFGVDQVALENPPFSLPAAKGVDVLPDGRIVASGNVFFSQFPNFQTITLATRRLENGGADATFNPGGARPGQIEYGVAGRSTFVEGQVIQNDDKLQLVGFLGSPNAFFLLRFDASGNPDATFGNGTPEVGFVETNFTVADQGEAIAFQQSGKIIAAGDAFFDAEHRQLALARYLNENDADEVFVEPTITAPQNLSNCDTNPPILSGAAQNPSNITVYVNGVENGRTITTGSENAWTFTPGAPLDEGPNTFQIVAEYKSGNMNACSDPACCGIGLGPQSCISEAIREKYCPSCIDFPICG